MKSKFVIEGLEGAVTTARDTVVNAARTRRQRHVHLRAGGTPLAEKLRDLFKRGIDGESF